jgi:hypothetical protein
MAGEIAGPPPIKLAYLIKNCILFLINKKSGLGFLVGGTP